LIDEAVATGAAEQRAVGGEDLGGKIGHLHRKASPAPALGRPADLAALAERDFAVAVARQYVEQVERDGHDFGTNALAAQHADLVDAGGIESRCGRVQTDAQREAGLGFCIGCHGGMENPSIRTGYWGCYPSMMAETSPSSVMVVAVVNPTA